MPRDFTPQSADPTRRLVLGAGLAAAATASCAAGTPHAAPSVERRLLDIETSLGGRVGVFVLDIASGRSFGRRAGERFAMCSTFKWAAALLALRAAGGPAAWTAVVPYGADDLVPYAPVTKAALDAGEALTLEDLAGAAVRISDNPAGNLLLARIGGPAGFTGLLRTAGDEDSRLDRWEVELNENLPGDPRDTTTPRAMAGLLRRLLFADPSAATPEAAIVREWMIASQTGLGRVRGGLPPDWRAGDKTGTSLNGAANDVGFVYARDARTPVLFAVYIDARDAATGESGKAHQAIGALIAREFGSDIR